MAVYQNILMYGTLTWRVFFSLFKIFMFAANFGRENVCFVFESCPRFIDLLFVPSLS